MNLEVLVMGWLAVVGVLVFGHFEERTPVARRVLKYTVVFGVLGVLVWTVGRPWTLVWVFGTYGLGVLGHVLICLRHGIHPLTAEPKDRYYRLRGWEQ